MTAVASPRGIAGRPSPPSPGPLTRTTLRRLVSAGVLLGGLSACGSDGPDGATTVTGAAWRIDPEPVMMMGDVEGPPDYLFDLIRSVHFADSGRIVVAQWGGNLVRSYDLDGNYVATLGRSGKGPGEFAHLSGTWVSQPDTVHVFDARLRRITSFTSDGTFVDARAVGRGAYFVGAFSDGTLVVTWIRDSLSRPGTASSGAGSFERDTMVYELVEPDGEYRAPFAEEPGRIRVNLPPRGEDSGPVPAPLLLHPFSPRPLHLVQGDTMYYTDGLRPVTLRTADGRVVRSIPLPPTHVRYGDAVDALRRDMVSRATPTDLQRLDAMPALDSIPKISAMLRDDQGRLWVKQYDPAADPWIRSRALRRLFWEAHGGNWWVLGPDGGVTATVTLPDGFIPMDVQGSLIGGITVDELEVERVAVYRVLRSD